MPRALFFDNVKELMFQKQGGIWQVISNLGGGIAFLAILSFVLHFLGRDLSIFEMVDHWGYETGFLIRIGMIVIGLAVFFLARKKV